MKLHTITLFFVFLGFASFGQEAIDTNSIESQFDNIYRTSTTYQVYKVIDKDKYQTLKKNVLDSLKDSKNLITEKENLLKIERDNIQKLNSILVKTKADLESTQKKENSISLFGAQLNKTTYNLILWFIIILLLFCLSFFIFKFYRSNIITKTAQESLLEVEKEFDIHRKKSLEREQKLRRQLQDEINKHRNT